jgi:hypothetical protein
MTALITLLVLAFIRGPAPSGAALIQRDAPGILASGPGSIAGVVTSERDGRPVRRVNVSLNGSAIGPTRYATSDENGRFAFASLPLGQYTLSASKPGFVTMHYGSRRPGRGPGHPITLAATAAAANVALRIPNGAAITGTVTDANGRPAQNVRLTVLQYRMSVGERELVPAPMTGVSALNTDDRGVYRIYGLPAGEYLVGAVPQGGDIRLTTAADVQHAQQQVQQGAAATGTMISAVPPGTPAPAVSAPTVSPSVAYARIFYPGTPDPIGAVPITLRAGEERSGVDFPLQFVRTARIDAAILDASGQPAAQAQVSLTQPGVPTSMGSWGVTRAQPGRFTATGVQPGQYVITARGSANGANAMWAAADVRVDGQDITGLTLTLRPGMIGTGRVAIESASGGAPLNVSAVRMTLTPVATTASGLAPPPPALAEVDTDGTFTMRGILPGAYRFHAVHAGTPDALLKTVIINQRDVTDRVVEIKPGDTLNNIVVTLMDRPADVSGTLLDAAGQPVPGLTIVLFTADRTFWGLQSRRTTTARPSPTGEFRFPGLLPGEYYISAVTDLDATDTGDPTFYEALVPASLKITVAPGERKTQDLRLATQ